MMIKEKGQNLEKGIVLWGLVCGLLLCGYVLKLHKIQTVTVDGFLKLKEDLGDAWIAKKIRNVPGMDQEERFPSVPTETHGLTEQPCCLEKPPKIFISYAPKDKYFIGERKDEKIPARLKVLQQDLEFLGIETFLDVTGNLRGNKRHQMKSHLEEADFIFLIGTPAFKQKATHHRLFSMDYFDLNAVPKTGDIVVLVKQPGVVIAYYVEEGQYQEAILFSSKLEFIPWDPQKQNIYEARSSEKTNELLEEILPKFKTFKNRQEEAVVSNAQFAYGIIMDRATVRPEILIPLLFSGEREDAFPSHVRHDVIRDFRNEKDYFSQMSSLDPVGIIPTICPALKSNGAYTDSVERLKADLKSAPRFK